MFENILSRRLEWYQDEADVSAEAHDFMDRLLCTDPKSRLGAKGCEEVKQHPFLAKVDWNKLLSSDAAFVPKISDPEDTDYFDARGATQQVFDDDDVPSTVLPRQAAPPDPTEDPAVAASEPAVSVRSPRERSETAPAPAAVDDFGTFNFKNLEVLKQANQDIIRKLRSEQMQPLGLAFDQYPPSHPRHAALTRGGSNSFDNRVSCFLRVGVRHCSPNDSSLHLDQSLRPRPYPQLDLRLLAAIHSQPRIKVLTRDDHRRTKLWRPSRCRLSIAMSALRCRDATQCQLESVQHLQPVYLDDLAVFTITGTRVKARVPLWTIALLLLQCRLLQLRTSWSHHQSSSPRLKLSTV